jgi:nitrogen fixation-related uncharacterized protein
MSGTEIIVSVIAVLLGLSVVGFFWAVTRE